MFTRIQWRIATIYVALIIVVLLGLALFVVHFLREQQLARLEADLEHQARLVTAAAEHRPPKDLDPLAKELGRKIGARVTFIARDGTVLGDTDQDPAVMDNHGAPCGGDPGTAQWDRAEPAP